MPGKASPAANQALLDDQARQLGFPDYATWAAWNAHRSKALRTNTTTQGPAAKAPPARRPAAPPPQRNFFQVLMDGLQGRVQ